VADWCRARGYRGWQLERRQAERQELSGEGHQNSLVILTREFLTGAGDWNGNVTRSHLRLVRFA